jgi:hypothetical protein
VKKRNKIILGAVVGSLIIFAFIFLMPMTPVYIEHEGTITFLGTELAKGDDSTDYDGAGTLTITDRNGVPFEGALTLGTDTTTTYPYKSGTTLYFIWASSTANAWDRWVIPVELPYSNFAETPFYRIQWSAGDPGHWVVDCFLAIENQPTLLGYSMAGAVWSATGTTTYDLSDNEYEVHGVLKIQVGANYGGLASYWDPEEDDGGVMDFIAITCDSNITSANVGFRMDYGGWVTCDDGEGWYYIVDLPTKLGDSSYLVRWDQEQMFGVIEIPFKLTGSVLDTATAGNDCELTFTLRSAQDVEDLTLESFDTDETNFSSAPTAEVVDIQV